MANVIKHKRGSGSDPGASDLVVGEVAIRTDVGKLFTKMDNGSVAEIAGGGSDIAINTLSSSSATGGGSATFNGSAYRFTLSAPPSVSAQQLLVSINGVIQKPVAGTGQPSEGFSVSGNDIILGDAPATGADFFILTFKSLGVSEPADNSVTSAKIADGAIVNADINASAAIAGSKISPNFGSQNIHTTGNISASGNIDGTGYIQVTNATPSLYLTDSNDNPDYVLRNNGGQFIIRDDTSGATRLAVNSDGHLDIAGNTDFGAGIDVTGAITGTGDMTIDTNTLHVDSSNNRVGIGVTNPASKLSVVDDSGIAIEATTNGANGKMTIIGKNSSGQVSAITRIESKPENSNNAATSTLFLNRDSGNAVNTHMTITSAGNVGIGTSSPDANLEIDKGSEGTYLKVGGDNASNGRALTFTSSTDGSNGALHTINALSGNGVIALATGSTERMRIDSGGDIFIGTSTDIAPTNGTNLCVSDGTIARLILEKQSTRKFEIGVQDFINIYDQTADAERLRIDSSGNITNGGAFTTNNFFSGGIHLKKQSDVGIKFQRTQSGDSQTWDWGVSSAGHLTAAHVGDSGGTSTTKAVFNKNGNLEINDGNLAINTAGHGIDFSATSGTGTSELLDDYEEGTWTVAVASGGVIASQESARYTKIGRMVHYQFYINMGTMTSTSTFEIGGLPYTAANATQYYFANGRVQNATHVSLQINPNTNGGLIYVSGGTTLKFNTASNNYILFSGVYEAT